MSKFIVLRPDGHAMIVLLNRPVWIENTKIANTYPSKYAAKKHLRMLDNIPEDVKIVELVTV